MMCGNRFFSSGPRLRVHVLHCIMDEGTNKRKRQRASIDNKAYSLRKRTKRPLKETDSQYSEDDYYSVQTVLLSADCQVGEQNTCCSGILIQRLEKLIHRRREPAEVSVTSAACRVEAEKTQSQSDRQADGHV